MTGQYGTAPLADTLNLVYGELRGFLEAFARLNDKCDHGCTFTFDRLPKANNIKDSVELMFRGAAKQVLTTLIEDWPNAVKEICKLWLFQFQVRSMPHLVDSKQSFELSFDCGRDRVLDWVMGRLSQIIQPSAVWKIQVETVGHYECAWDDVAFEAVDQSYLLHLGVSD